MLVTAVAVDFGAKDGHDFEQIPAELLHWGQVFGLVQNGDCDAEVVADEKDDLAAETQQAGSLWVRMSSLTLPWSSKSRSCLKPVFL